MKELKPCPFCGEKGVHQKDCYLNLFFESEVLDANIPWEVMVVAWNKRHERTCRIVPHGHLITLSDGTELYESACSECNAYIGDEDNYCSICGAKVATQND